MHSNTDVVFQLTQLSKHRQYLAVFRHSVRRSRAKEMSDREYTKHRLLTENFYFHV